MGALDCVPNRMQSTGSTEIFAIKMSTSTLNEPRRDVESQCSKDSSQKRPFLWWTILLDAPLMLIVLALIGLFELGVIPSHKTGFYCGDPALSFPFLGDTVTTSTLISILFLAPIAIVLLVELAFTDTEDSFRQRSKQAFKNFIWVYRGYIFGTIFNFAVIEVMKGVMGNPRPTFFDICQPDTGIPDETCVRSEFVRTFKCTSTKHSEWLMNDASHSFPSGHTSLSVHCGIFLAWYLQKRAFDWKHRTVFVVPVLQMLSLSFPAVASLTRITDRRHHWWDVLAGFCIGVLTAFYAATILCQNFRTIKSKNEKVTEDSLVQNSARTLIYDTQRSFESP